MPAYPRIGILLAVVTMACTSPPGSDDGAGDLAPPSRAPNGQAAPSQTLSVEGSPTTTVLHPTKPAARTEGFPGPVSGTYRYEVVVRELDGTERTQDQTMEVGEPLEHGSVWLQEVTTHAALIRRIDTHRWAQSAISLLARDHPTLIRSSEGTQSEPNPCRYQPPEVLYRLPLRSGMRWSTEGSCANEKGDAEPYSFTRTVTGRDSIEISGRPFGCHLVEERVDGKVNLVRCFSSELGVTLRVVRSRVPDGLERVVTTLVSLPRGHPALN